MVAVYVSIGSNVQRERHIRLAVRLLRERFGTLVRSSVYEGEAVGFAGDPFFNLVVSFHTDLPVERVAAALREIERSCGRSRSNERLGPRTLDLDLLLYGDLVARADGFEVPRGEMTSHAFVLKPLCDIAGAVVHPTSGRTYAEHWARFEALDQAVWLADFQLDVESHA